MAWGWLILAAWLVGWFPAARVAARSLASNRTYCHGEGDGYRWSDPNYCSRYCKKGCWRGDGESLSFANATYACLMALFWPLAAAPWWIWRTWRPAPASVEQSIERLERELGLGGHQ